MLDVGFVELLWMQIRPGLACDAESGLGRTRRHSFTSCLCAEGKLLAVSGEQEPLHAESNLKKSNDKENGY